MSYPTKATKKKKPTSEDPCVYIYAPDRTDLLICETHGKTHRVVLTLGKEHALKTYAKYLKPGYQY